MPQNARDPSCQPVMRGFAFLPKQETKSSRGHAALAALATVLPAFPPARRASLCAPLAAACAAALPGVLCGRGAAAHSAQLSALYSHALPPPAAAAAAGGGTDVPDSVWGAFVSAALDAGEAAPSVERWWAEDEASSGGGAAAVPAEALSAAAAACCAAMAACGAAQQETLAVRKQSLLTTLLSIRLSPHFFPIARRPLVRCALGGRAHLPRTIA